MCSAPHLEDCIHRGKDGELWNGGEQKCADRLHLGRRQLVLVADLVLEKREVRGDVRAVAAGAAHDGDALLVALEVVRLVDDLVLDHLLQHVLQRDDTWRPCVR